MRINYICGVLALSVGLGGCYSPYDFAQKAGLETAKALGIGVTAEWYESNVNEDPTLGFNGEDRESAYAECEALGLEMINAMGAYNGATMAPGYMLSSGGLSTMNQQAKAARGMTDQCMMQKGFTRTRKW